VMVVDEIDASLHSHLMEVLLGWFADGGDADAGLLGFRLVSESLGTTSWYLRMLRDSPAAAERLSFSRMTFTHQMVRLLLMEQIYRAFKINRGEKYHW